MKIMEALLCYYVITWLYCTIMSARRWNKDVMSGGLGITPALDILAISIMCWALAPVDIFLTWTKVYKDAEEARRKHADTDNSLDGLSYKKGEDKVF
jgi:hypothetical protein